jgi:hypothetical protein
MIMNRQFSSLIALVALVCVSQAAEAQCFLKQSTASQVVQLGPFVDDTDFKTPETALTIANTDIKLSKGASATSQTNKNSGGATHIATGDYYTTLDATDTNTVGPLRIKVAVSGALAVWRDCFVVEEAVFDALYGASSPGYVANAPVSVAQWSGTNVATPDTAGYPKVTLKTGTGAGELSVTSGVVSANATQISGDSTAADNLETAFDDTPGPVPHLGITDQGTAQSGSTSTTLVLRSAANFTNDNRIVGASCHITAGTGTGESLTVASYVNSTDTATMSGTWPTTPDNTSFYRCYGTSPGSGGSGLDAAGVRAAIGLASANLDTQLGTIDDYVDTEVAAIKTKTDFLPSATAGASGGLFIAGTNAATTVTTSFTTTFTGNLTGSVASVTGNVGGNVTGSVGSVATGGITAASIATDAIGAAELASDAGTEIGTAVWATTTRELTALDEDNTTLDLNATTVGTVTTATNVTTVNGLAANVITAAATATDFTTEVTSGLATASALATVDDFVDTEVAAIKAVTDKMDTALEADGGVYRLTTNALEQAPTGGGASAATIADAVWDEARTGHTTSGTFGFFLDSAVSGVSTGGVSADTIADAVWDEVLSGHTTSGTSGERMGRIPNAAAGGNGGLPTVNANNQIAGIQVLDEDSTTIDVDSSIWSTGTRRLSDGTNIVLAKGTGITGLNDLDASGIRAALGLTTANIDTQLASAIADSTGVTTLLSRLSALRAGYLDNLSAGAVATAASIGALNNLSATQVRDIVIEDQGSGVTLGCAISVVLAYAGGDLTTSGSSSTYKDPSGGENRITGTVSSPGNRAASVSCPSY